jgi:hypothetical protein
MVQWAQALYTGITYTGTLIDFFSLNMAGAGDFGTLGLNATLGLTLTVLEVVPNGRLLLSTSTVTNGKNVTVYLPLASNMTVTGASAYHWNSTTKLLRLTAPLGLAQITINLIAGAPAPVFYVASWFIDQAGNYFHVTGLFSSIYSSMITLASSFTSALSNGITLLYQIYRLITGVIGPVIFWFTGIVNFFIAFFTQAGNLIDAAKAQSSAINEIFGLLGNPEIIMMICAVGFLVWINSIQDRSRQRGGGDIQLIIGDIQTAEWILGTLYNWSMAIFNFMWGLISWFIGLIVNVVT